jgi:hypothetical protein
VEAAAGLSQSKRCHQPRGTERQHSFLSEDVWRFSNMKGKLVIGVCVVGKLNLDLILFPRPEQLSPDRELLASNKAFAPGILSEIFADN